ncbi:MAG: cytochrome c oxidase subunit II [Planctomycetota bacterium]
MTNATVLNLLIQDPQKPEPPPWADTPTPKIDEYGQLQELASTFDHVDGLFYFTYAVCIFFFVVITAVLLYSCVAHRRKTWDQKPLSNVTHNTPLEVVWTVIPLIIVMVMFAWGFKGSLDMTTVPHEAQRNTYKAHAQQWAWTFTYPDGSSSIGEVWVEEKKAVQFYLQSTDVLHAFYVPAMRVKRDVVPGRYQTVWFEPTKKGTYHLFCAEYCGNSHSRMYAKVHVVDAATMEKQPWNQWPADDAPLEDLVAAGGGLAKKLCSTCHSFDGSKGIGPSWKGLFTKNADGSLTGRQRRVLADGEEITITTDDAYIRESIAMPNAKIVCEEPYNLGGMKSFDYLEEKKVNGILAFMKSLADE